MSRSAAWMFRRAPRRSSFNILVSTLLAATVLAGCAMSPPSGGQGSAPYAPRVVRVVAGENVWGSIAAQIGGAHAAVTSIIASPQTDPHAYEPTAADARRLADAQVAVMNGVGYDPWMNRLLAAAGGSRTVLDVGELVGVAPGGNPHLWYSPGYVAQFTRAIANAMARVDPADRAYFLRRQAHFDNVALASYHEVIARIRARYAGRPVGGSESVVVYLCGALGLHLVTPPTFLRAVTQGTDVSAADKVTIDAQIRNRAIDVYLENVQNSTPDVQAQVAAARAAHISVVAMSETLRPAGATFQAWQTAQLRALASALETTHA